ncbi:hypothetical protein B0H13DRAFT_2366249 [Mycena leptocephala]|nr:hypothetical protein B0H13DRAFT_2366249 [Mycena leptocephala]
MVSEYATLQQSVAAMVSQLDEARHLSSDPPDGPHLVVSQRVSTGGRPRIEIDPIFWPKPSTFEKRHILPLFSTTPLAPFAGGLCNIASPRRASLVTRSYSSTSRPTSTLTDEQLDTLVMSILEVFPDFGHRMLIGRLKAGGHHVLRERITASYLCVHGSPGQFREFGIRAIHRQCWN